MEEFQFTRWRNVGIGRRRAAFGAWLLVGSVSNRRRPYGVPDIVASRLLAFSVASGATTVRRRR